MARVETEVSTANEYGFALAPRVSIFRFNKGIYLYDPATKTCASMNEAMLSFMTKPKRIDLLNELSHKDYRKLANISKQLVKLGIFTTSESTNQKDTHTVYEAPNPMINLAFFITTKCNLKCAYCYARGGEMQKTISRDIWRTALDYYFSTLNLKTNKERANQKHANLVIHGGGEPTVEFATLNEIVSEFNSRAQDVGLRPEISLGTNGTYDDSIQQWIIENDISVTLSLDGPRDIHNRLRPFVSGQPSYDIVIRNLKGLIKAGVTVSVRATITNENLWTMKESVELLSALGVKAVHFEPVSLTGRCVTSNLSRPDAQQFGEMFLKCYLLGLKRGIDVRYSGLRFFEKSNHRYCGACGYNFCVTPEGNITTCYEVLDATEPAASVFFIGKVDPMKSQVLLDNSRITGLKQRISENMAACQDCLLKYDCAGDCPVKSFKYTGHDLYSPDPFRCLIAKTVNTQIIAWLADGVIEPVDIEHSKIMCL